MIRTIVAYSGYVEETSIMCLVAYHKKGFKDAKSAITSLGKALSEYDSMVSESAECCGQDMTKYKFCGMCGKEVKRSVETPDEDKVKWAIDEAMWGKLSSRDTNPESNDGWDLHSIHGRNNPLKNPKEVLVIYQNFESLAAAIIDGREMERFWIEDAYMLDGSDIKWGDIKLETEE